MSLFVKFFFALLVLAALCVAMDPHEKLLFGGNQDTRGDGSSVCYKEDPPSIIFYGCFNPPKATQECELACAGKAKRSKGATVYHCVENAIPGYRRAENSTCPSFRCFKEMCDGSGANEDLFPPTNGECPLSTCCQYAAIPGCT
jgi:hypothetical protein